MHLQSIYGTKSNFLRIPDTTIINARCFFFYVASIFLFRIICVGYNDWDLSINIKI